MMGNYLAALFRKRRTHTVLGASQEVDERTSLQALPVPVLGRVLLAAGSKAGSACLSCKLLYNAWCSEASTFAGASQFLIASHSTANTATAILLVYEAKYEKIMQLLQSMAPQGTTREEVVLLLIRELAAGGSHARNHSAEDQRELLRKAAAARHVDVLRYLISAGVDAGANGGMALFVAAAHGFMEVVGLLLETGICAVERGVVLLAALPAGDAQVAAAVAVDPEARRVAFRLAAEDDLADTVRALATGVDAADRTTAFFMAADGGRVDVVAALEASVDAAERRAVFLRAARAGRADVVTVLAAGVGAEARGGALCLSAVEDLEDHGAVVAALLEAGVDAEDARYALLAASVNGRTGAVKALAAAATCADRDEALRLAALQGHEGAVAALLATGVDGVAWSEALWAASQKGHEGVVEVLAARRP